MDLVPVAFNKDAPAQTDVHVDGQVKVGRARKKPKRVWLFAKAGDVPGHEFHGNQYQTVSGTYFHGTNADFNEFDPKKTSHGRVWFSGDREYASVYGHVREVAIDARNVKTYDASHEGRSEWARNDVSDKELQRQGYDGVVFTENGKVVNGYVWDAAHAKITKAGEAPGHVFRGNQYREGTSDPQDPKASDRPLSQDEASAQLAQHLGGARKGVAFRIVSDDDYNRMLATGVVDTSGKGNLEMKERSGIDGMAVSPAAPDLRYVASEGTSRALALAVKPDEMTHYNPWDAAVTKPLDSTRILGVSQPLSRTPDGHYLIHTEHTVPGMGNVDKFIADHPRKPNEPSYAWQGRIVDGLNPVQKSELLFITREHYAPVDYLANGMAKFRADHGLPQPQIDISEQRAVQVKSDKVGAAFEHAPDAATDPNVKAAFDDFKRQNDEQWHLLTDPVEKGGLGVKVDFVPQAEPYQSAAEQADDLRNNHHLSIASGLGGKHQATMSTQEYDRFRAVHDSFGHAGIGGGFDRHGEYQAWLAHMTMYTGAGAKAMASEYHGVNSAMWAGDKGTPGTGKSVLLPDDLIASPWDDEGDLVRKAADPLAGLGYLAEKLGLDAAWAKKYSAAPWHTAPTRATSVKKFAFFKAGEGPGHPFRGNQYVTGESDPHDPEAPREHPTPDQHALKPPSPSKEIRASDLKPGMKVKTYDPINGDDEIFTVASVKPPDGYMTRIVTDTGLASSWDNSEKFQLVTDLSPDEAAKRITTSVHESGGKRWNGETTKGSSDYSGNPDMNAAIATKIDINRRLAARLITEMKTDPKLAKWGDAEVQRLGIAPKDGRSPGPRAAEAYGARARAIWSAVVGHDSLKYESARQDERHRYSDALDAWIAKVAPTLIEKFDGNDAESLAERLVQFKRDREDQLKGGVLPKYQKVPETAQFYLSQPDEIRTVAKEDPLYGSQGWGDKLTTVTNEEAKKRLDALPEAPRPKEINYNDFLNEPLPDDPRVIALNSRIRRTIDTWAGSSGDSTTPSIALQRAVAEHFQVPDQYTAPLQKFAEHGHVVKGDYEEADPYLVDDSNAHDEYGLAHYVKVGDVLLTDKNESFTVTEIDHDADSHITFVQDGTSVPELYQLDPGHSVRYKSTRTENNPWAVAGRLVAAEKPFYEHLVRAVYDNTQADLKAMGVTEVLLHRGMHIQKDVPEAQPPVTEYRYRDRDRSPHERVDKDTAVSVYFDLSPQTRSITMQPLSSWSADRETAQSFSGLSDYNERSILMSAIVPAERIFSVAAGTGPGSLIEREVVVIGGPGEARVDFNPNSSYGKIEPALMSKEDFAKLDISHAVNATPKEADLNAWIDQVGESTTGSGKVKSYNITALPMGSRMFHNDGPIVVGVTPDEEQPDHYWLTLVSVKGSGASKKLGPYPKESSFKAYLDPGIENPKSALLSTPDPIKVKPEEPDTALPASTPFDADQVKIGDYIPFHGIVTEKAYDDGKLTLTTDLDAGTHKIGPMDPKKTLWVTKKETVAKAVAPPVTPIMVDAPLVNADWIKRVTRDNRNDKIKKALGYVKPNTPIAKMTHAQFRAHVRDNKHSLLPKDIAQSSPTLKAAAVAVWEEQKHPRVPSGSEGGGEFAGVGQTFSPITKDENRGNGRAVSGTEFQRLAHEGHAKLDVLRNIGSPNQLAHHTDLINKTYNLARKSWGGATIDAHTGKLVKAHADVYAITTKEPGMETIKLPEDATPEAFAAAYNQALKTFGPELDQAQGHLGVFHDDDLHEIHIDPVTVVDNTDDVERIGAASHSVGGAYHFKSGNGYWPPYVDESISEAPTQTTKPKLSLVKPAQPETPQLHQPIDLISPHAQQPEKAQGRSAARPDNPHATELEHLSADQQAAITKQVMTAGKLITDKPLTRAQLVQNLNILYKEAVASDQAAVDEGKGWYNHARDIGMTAAKTAHIDDRHGIGMLASLSPQADWDENAAMTQYLAEKLYADAPLKLSDEQLAHANTTALASRNAKTAGFTPLANGMRPSEMTPIQAAVAIKAVAQMVEEPRVATKLTKSGEPARYSWSTGLGNVTKAIQIYRGEDPETILNGHKVRSFFNNIADPNDEQGRGDVTIDTHAVSASVHARIAATSKVLDKLFSSGSSSKAENTLGTYAYFADAYREAARESGLTPNQYQAVVWIHWRHLGEDKRFADFEGEKKKKTGGGGPSGGKLRAAGLIHKSELA